MTETGISFVSGGTPLPHLEVDGVTLASMHAAKGLEWDRVYHLDPWLIGQSEQEQNLRYVIQTRAKKAYYEIDSRDIV